MSRRPGPPAAASALVTGASRGIGRAVAGVLAAEGGPLVVSSRGGEALEEVAAATGGTPVAADLCRPDEVQRLARRAVEILGGVPEVLVNNAGVFALVPAAETPPEVFEEHLAINVAAPFRLVRAFLPAMLERGSGSLVHVGSVAGRTALPGNVAYSASKFGLRAMHEVLRLELEGTGVRSLLVEPGPVDTGAWDALEPRLGRDLPARSDMLSPGQVADGVLTLLRGEDEGELILPAG